MDWLHTKVVYRCIRRRSPIPVPTWLDVVDATNDATTAPNRQLVVLYLRPNDVPAAKKKSKVFLLPYVASELPAIRCYCYFLFKSFSLKPRSAYIINKLCALQGIEKNVSCHYASYIYLYGPMFCAVNRGYKIAFYTRLEQSSITLLKLMSMTGGGAYSYPIQR